MKIYPITIYTNDISKNNTQRKMSKQYYQTPKTNNSISFGSLEKGKMFFLSLLLTLGGCVGCKCSNEMEKLGPHKASGFFAKLLETFMPSQKLATKIIETPDGRPIYENKATKLYANNSVYDIDKYPEQINYFYAINPQNPNKQYGYRATYKARYENTDNIINSTLYELEVSGCFSAKDIEQTPALQNQINNVTNNGNWHELSASDMPKEIIIAKRISGSTSLGGFNNLKGLSTSNGRDFVPKNGYKDTTIFSKNVFYKK